MADSKSEFYSAFLFPEAAADEFMAALSAFSEGDQKGVRPEILEKMGFDAKSDDFLEWARETEISYLYADTKAEYENGKLFLSGENADMAQLATLLGHVMEAHDIRTPVIIECSFSSSPPRPGEYGGEVWVVGPGFARSKGTAETGREIALEMMKEIDGSEKKKRSAPRM